jgi:hypothetical protein
MAMKGPLPTDSKPCYMDHVSSVISKYKLSHEYAIRNKNNKQRILLSLLRSTALLLSLGLAFQFS